MQSSQSLRSSQEVVAPAAHPLPTLHEGGLVLEGGKRLLEPSNFSLTASLALLISLRLRDAPVLDLRVVLHHCSEFRTRGLLVSCELANFLVEILEVLCLVLHVLILQSFGLLVLEGRCLVLRLCIGLLRLLCCEVLRKVGFTNLKDVNDAATRATCLSMEFWHCWLL